jgi:hypothetical protein
MKAFGGIRTWIAKSVVVVVLLALPLGKAAAVDGTVWPYMHHSCYINWPDPCTGAYRVAVGVANAVFYKEGGVNHWDPHAYSWYNSDAQCSYGDLVGVLSRTRDLVVYVEGARALDTSNDNRGCMKIGFTASQYSSSDCSGNPISSGSDNTDSKNTTNTATEQYLAECDDFADCVGGWGDSCNATWHLPDILFDPPASNSTRSYKFTITTYACQYGCLACTTSEASGCFRVFWTD